MHTCGGLVLRKRTVRERKVKLRISAEVLEKAKEMGLNISKICENALREKIRLLRTKAEMT